MRTLLKHFVIETISLYLASILVTGIIFKNGYTTMIFAGIALMLISAVVKPVINILLLPINLITFGLFKWVGVVVALYLVTLVVPGFEIVGFNFSGLDSFWLDLPAINLVGFLAFLAFSFLISLISSIIGWVFN